MSDSEDDFHSADEGEDDALKKDGDSDKGNICESLTQDNGVERQEKGVDCNSTGVEEVNRNTSAESEFRDQSVEETEEQDCVDQETSRSDDLDLENKRETQEIDPDDSPSSESQITLTDQRDSEKTDTPEAEEHDRQSQDNNTEIAPDYGDNKLVVGSATSISPDTDEVKQSDPEKPNEEESDDVSGWDDNDWGWEASLESAVESATHAVSSVFHSFEQTLGIPDPAYMAKVVVEEGKQDTAEKSQTEDVPDQSATASEPTKSSDAENQPQSSWFSSGWGSWGVSGLSNIVQSAGKDLVSGGLDTLEYLGKKTMHVIAEGDPGIRNKTESVVAPFIKKDVTLSEALQEAKRKQSHESESDLDCKNEATFRDKFDQFQGFAHLEALEMLSNECERKLQRILKVQSEEALKETRNILLNLKQELESEDEIEDPELDITVPEQLRKIVTELHVAVKPDKLVNAFERAATLVTSETDRHDTLSESFDQMMSGLAEVTCRSLELMQKVAELVLLPDFRPEIPISTKAAKIKEILEILKPCPTALSSSFADHLNKMSADEESDVNLADSITELHLEGSNCSSYLDDCHKLLLPVLQLAAIK